ncbi:MAG: PQQ-binding-like beta-propeller repeat protein [Bryobacteraceae bacterium]|nr:PQQ-binding-like beta-propeller repeat protein [Bryobacteraceae bacterium]
MLLLLLILSAAAATAEPARMIEAEGVAKKYWSRWRGPSGQGLVQSGNYPDAWSDTENMLWKVKVPGTGHSSPIVWKDRIFITTAYDGARRAILCFNRGDGKLLWEAAAPAPPTVERLFRKNSHATATPVTDGGRVYALFGNAGLLAVDFNGKQAWHYSFGATSNYHGPGGSPLLYKDRIIFYQDQSSDSFVAAVHAATGKLLWKTPRKETVGWGTPIAIRAGNRDEVIVSGQDAVRAYDPDSGKELWMARGNTMEVTPTPAVAHGLVFAPSGRAGPTLAIRPGGAGDVTDTHIVWQTPRGSPFIPSPLVHGDYLYLVNDMTSIATCLEATTGKTVWQGRLGEAAREGFSASPVAVEGKVFFTNDEGETFVLAAGPEFNLLRVNRLNEQTLATPALVDGKWYFRTASHLIAIGR